MISHVYRFFCTCFHNSNNVRFIFILIYSGSNSVSLLTRLSAFVNCIFKQSSTRVGFRILIIFFFLFSRSAFLLVAPLLGRYIPPRHRLLNGLLLRPPTVYTALSLSCFVISCDITTSLKSGAHLFFGFSSPFLPLFQFVLTQAGPNNRTCLSTDNFVTIICRKACDMRNVSRCSRENVPNLSVSLAFRSTQSGHWPSLCG